MATHNKQVVFGSTTRSLESLISLYKFHIAVFNTVTRFSHLLSSLDTTKNDDLDIIGKFPRSKEFWSQSLSGHRDNPTLDELHGVMLEGQRCGLNENGHNSTQQWEQELLYAKERQEALSLVRFVFGDEVLFGTSPDNILEAHTDVYELFLLLSEVHPHLADFRRIMAMEETLNYQINAGRLSISTLGPRTIEDLISSYRFHIAVLNEARNPRATPRTVPNYYGIVEENQELQATWNKLHEAMLKALDVDPPADDKIIRAEREHKRVKDRLWVLDDVCRRYPDESIGFDGLHEVRTIYSTLLQEVGPRRSKFAIENTLGMVFKEYEEFEKRQFGKQDFEHFYIDNYANAF